MLSKSLLSLAVFLGFLLSPRIAAGDDSSPIRFHSIVQCATTTGQEIELPPGRFLPENNWQALEEDYKKMDDDNTRLIAENQVYKENDDPVSKWRPALALFVLGTALGAYVF